MNNNEYVDKLNKKFNTNIMLFVETMGIESFPPQDTVTQYYLMVNDKKISVGNDYNDLNNTIKHIYKIFESL